MTLFARGRLLLAGLIVAGPVTLADADGTRWLPIVATRDTLAKAVAAATELGGLGQLSIVRSDDCANLKRGLYLVVTMMVTAKATAEASQAAWRSSVPDAYLRGCEPAPGSLVGLGLPRLIPP